MPDHSLFDKRLKKPKIYRIKQDNTDYAVQEIDTYKVGKAEIRFNTPNVISIFINISSKELLKAKEIYKKLISSKVSQRSHFHFSPAETVSLFDYLEHIQTSIITLYSAIESLINILIPDEFILEERNNKGIKEIWDKSAIERWKSTSEKLKVVIPKALAIKNPTSYRCWSKFCEFEALRNDIVHIKSHSLHNEDTNKKIIGLLLEESVFAKLKAAEDLIKEISKSTPFHPEFPILNNTEDLKAVVVETFDELGWHRSD